MDILEANFAHLIPRSPEGPFHKPDDEPGAPLIDARKDYLAEMTELLDALPSWDRKSAETVFDITKSICEYLWQWQNLPWDEQELMLDPLSMCADLLKKVISMPQLFKDSKDYNKSAKKALSFVKCIKRIVHLRVEYEARVNDIAQEMFKQHKHLPPHDVEPENDKTQWPSWSSNVVGVGSEEQRAAIVRKSTFKAIASYLPRAGCAIVEDWREDLNGTVSSIAQIKPSKEVEAQSATWSGTYFISTDDGLENLTRSTQTADQPGGDVTEEVIDDRLSTIGECLINLDGLEPEVPRGQPFGMWETTHMNMSRMKEGRKERASKLDDFGRAW